MESARSGKQAPPSPWLSFAPLPIFLVQSMFTRALDAGLPAQDKPEALMGLVRKRCLATCTHRDCAWMDGRPAPGVAAPYTLAAAPPPHTPPQAQTHPLKEVSPGSAGRMPAAVGFHAAGDRIEASRQ